jgi:hypothetical protein
MELKYIDANKPLNLFVLKQLKINSGKKNLCPLEEPIPMSLLVRRNHEKLPEKVSLRELLSCNSF